MESVFRQVRFLTNRLSDRRWCVALPLSVLIVCFSTIAPKRAAASNSLPEEAAKVLKHPSNAVMYSLEPWSPRDGDDFVAPLGRLHGYVILGHASLDAHESDSGAKAIERAIQDYDGTIAACFDPRHALRIVANNHVYDFLICYACHQLEVYRDDERIASLGAIGSTRALNSLLVQHLVPLSDSDPEWRAAENAVKHHEAEQRWLAAAPSSVRGLIPETLSAPSPDHTRFIAPLVAEWPDRSERIRHLLEWFGQGAGPWTGVPAYESVAEQLLLTFSTPELVDAIDTSELSKEGLEGAARLLAGWDFRRDRPEDARRLDSGLKRILLQHVKEYAPANLGAGESTDRLERAERAFGQQAN
jgi:hypothetical protein